MVAANRAGATPRAPNPTTEFTLGESEEHLIEQGQIRIQNLRTSSYYTPITHGYNCASKDIKEDDENHATQRRELATSGPT